jgi:hypothetical protein
MKLYLVTILFATFEFSCAAPQDYLGNIVNAIADTVQGKEYDSPPYAVVATYEVGSNSFEERNYEGGKNWACVNNANSDNRMFMTLFGYISGANVGNKEIAMTIPVSTKWTKLSDGTFQKEMCFYLSEEYQANPPQPTNSRVYIVNRPAMTIYTRKVPGYMDDEDWLEESQTLDSMIGSKSFQVKSDEFYANGYNSPMQFWNRRNEPWKVKV